MPHVIPMCGIIAIKTGIMSDIIPMCGIIQAPSAVEYAEGA